MSEWMIELRYADSPWLSEELYISNFFDLKGATKNFILC